MLGQVSNGVSHTLAVASTSNQATATQPVEVIRNRRLRNPELLLNRYHAHFLLGEQLQNSEPCRMAHCK